MKPLKIGPGESVIEFAKRMREKFKMPEFRKRKREENQIAEWRAYGKSQRKTSRSSNGSKQFKSPKGFREK